MDFAQRLIRALDSRGIKPHQRASFLRRLTGLKDQSVRKWLDGRGMPEPGRHKPIADALGVRRAWLFDAEGPMHTAGSGMIQENSAAAIQALEHAFADPAHRQAALAWEMVVYRINTYIASGTLVADDIEAIDKMVRALAEAAHRIRQPR